MPAPQKISDSALRTLAAMLVEDLGPERVTMRLVAERLGVRAPSLYKHVADREALLGLVRDEAIAEITRALRDADLTADSAHDQLCAHAHAVRAFALRRPHAFALVFHPRNLPPAPPAILRESIVPIFRACSSLVGEEQALAATRTLTAWLTGFASMENAAAFQLDGDIDEAFDFGIRTVIAGLQHRKPTDASTA